jgi:hypothetical protein
MNLIEPTPQNVREEIEYIKDPELGMWLKDLLTFGARSVEFAGVNCKDERAYGTVGVGHAWLDEYKPKVLTDDERNERTTTILNNPNMPATNVIMLMNAPPTPLKIAVFKIPIAKKHRLQGEPVIYRHAAIPWDKKYEPWAEEIYNYYQQRGKELLFPNNRRHYLDSIRAKGIFKQFCYPVERYSIRTVMGKLEIIPENTQYQSATNKTVFRTYKKSKKNDDIFQVDTWPKHLKGGKQHFLRHVRTKELNNFYEIKETLALCSFIGWAPSGGPEAMIARYGDLYVNYNSYIGNLFKVRK